MDATAIIIRYAHANGVCRTASPAAVGMADTQDGTDTMTTIPHSSGASRLLRVLAVAALTAGLPACASSYADRLQAQGEALTGAGEDYERGQDLIAKGEKRLARARRDEADAAALIERGERLKADAEARANAAR